jgi:hypothetical protein
VQAQLQADFECDSPAFLLLHDDKLDESSGHPTGKLPFTIYETFTPHSTTARDEEMDIEYSDISQSLRYRVLTYTLDTSPDEAIALRDVVEQATVASISNELAAKQQDQVQQSQAEEQPSSPTKTKSKGKAKISAALADIKAPLQEPVNLDQLTTEEEECE